MSLLTRVKDLFGSLDPEEEPQEKRKIEVAETSALKEMIEGLERGVEQCLQLRKRKITFSGREEGEMPYPIFASHIPQKYSAADILAFLQYFKIKDDVEKKDRLSQFIGFYISALINSCRDKEIAIFTADLKQPWDFIGYRNPGKHILVIGDVGDNLAREMTGGSIEVRGSANDDAGYLLKGGKVVVKKNTSNDTAHFMEGGTLIVEGNTGDDLGKLMNGGRVVVHGNVNGTVGDGMDGGSIRVHGEYKELGNMTGGAIYHKKKCVMRDGEEQW